MALTDTFVRKIKFSGATAGDKHTDGQGMHLLVNSVGKYWRLNYRFHGKQKTLALGVYPAVSLAMARKLRGEAKALLAEGKDPVQAKHEKARAKAVALSNTFEAVARQWLSKSAANRAESTQNKVQAWLCKDVFPRIGKIPIADLSPLDVLETVRVIERRGAIGSAHRVKQICGQILRFGVAAGLAPYDVTADLKGALSAIPKSHYAAITNPSELGPLLRAIDSYSGHPYCCAALRLAPLVFVRPGELRSAEWSEIDLDAAQWRIPGQKMKRGKEHIVPLSTQAISILRNLAHITGAGKFVFPSIRTGERCMSENTLNAALRSMGYSREVVTAHGFRATARTILDEVLQERFDLIEHQLAHEVKDPNGRAYNRTAHLPARHQMMQRWSDYLERLKQGAEIISINKNFT